MKEMVHRFAFPGRFVVILSAFLALIFFTSTNYVMAAMGKASHVERTESHIKSLHQKLKITPAQEGLWTALTEVMRENAKNMDSLIQARREEKAKPMNAVEDLKSYSQIVEAHADALKKFIPAFESLYAAMSDDQKKNADALFRAQRHGKSRRK